MAARLKDVADLAGVSVKTVSNVVNKRPNVATATRARVEAAIAELHYRPNESARHLKYGRSGLLTLAVPQMEAPYFAELSARVVAAASELGWIVLLENTRGMAEAEREVLDGQQVHLTDGVIFSPLSTSATELLQRSDDLPMVLLGERQVHGRFDHVGVDSVAAAHAMTTQLIQLGRRRIAAVGWEPAGTGEQRHRGYARALTDAGLSYDPDLVVGVDGYVRADGKAAMLSLLESTDPPDAVFCFNDLLGIGAMRGCADAGVAVPGEVAVAGFDDITESRYSNPRLTTVSVDTDRLAREAVRLLLRRIADPDADPVDVVVPWRLRIRESTGGRIRSRIIEVRD
jgi:DNA-binding LacI/PurR family transcriptional regulator